MARARVPTQESCGGSEAGSYLRRIDSCITQLQAQGPLKTCNESQEEETKCNKRLTKRFSGSRYGTWSCWSGNESSLYTSVLGDVLLWVGVL